MSGGWLIGVDIGGTFTDIVAVDAVDGRPHHLKVPSVPANPAAGVLAGLAALRREVGVATDVLELVLHGTTIATNAIIERRLAPTALITTAGFRDVLEIGRHWRRELYDPYIESPRPLVAGERRFEVDERTAFDGAEIRPLDTADSTRVVNDLRAAGVEAVAVAFLHSYANPAHEREMAERLRAADGNWFVCISSGLSREVREFERTSTTVLNAALMPLMHDYMSRLEDALAGRRGRPSIFVTQSNGGALTPRGARSRPISLALSGPAAGVVACAKLSRAIGRGEVIAFDMGGTSTDISILRAHEPRFTSELSVGDVPIRLPTIDIQSIGAGGGSIATVDPSGALRVGPESAGSDPGPACYARGGTEPTVTDCQLALGRLSLDAPLAGHMTLDAELAAAAIDRIASRLDIDVDAAAAGVLEVANAAMERAVRVALRKRGDDPREFALIAFGGAGALHACELARRLSIETVIVPAHPGTLSALGLIAADVRLDFAASAIHRTDMQGLAKVANDAFAVLERQAIDELRRDGLGSDGFRFERSCDIRYVGQAYEVNVPIASPPIDEQAIDGLLERFHELHRRIFAFASPGEPCELVTLRVAATAVIAKPSIRGSVGHGGDGPVGERLVHMPIRGWTPTPVYRRDRLGSGSHISGPAVIHQADATTLVPPFAAASVDSAGTITLSIGAG